MADTEDLVLRVRQIDNGYLLLGRSKGERLPSKYYPDLNAVQKDLIFWLWETFKIEPEDDEEPEDAP
jgi:hypothetical protein